MRKHETRIREEAKRLLEEGKIRLLIGYANGFEASRPVPAFLRDPDRVQDLVFNEFCGAGIAKYVLDEVTSVDAMAKENLPPVGIVAKGCDALGLERLIVDNRVAREDLYIIGLGCEGIVDASKVENLSGEAVESAALEAEAVVVTTASGQKRFPKSECLMDKCVVCQNPTPRIRDILLGEEVTKGPVGVRDYSGVYDMENLSPDERYEFWSRQFDRCLRCFACRNVCPACNCTVCSLDEREPEWLGRDTGKAEQFMFHFTRAFHVAGRCVGCGECERACPVSLPLMLLNEKFMKDIRDLFDEPAPYLPSEVEPLGKFCPEDPEGWREEDTA